MVGTAAPVDTDAAAPASARRRRLRADLAVLALVGVLLVAALAAGVASVYREFYSATAFVERYLGLLADGRAADALAVPGVAVDSSVLAAEGLPETASEALLRAAVLGPLTQVRVTSEEGVGAVTDVTVAYRAGGYPGTTVFAVERAGWIGAAPAWRFARSPLAVMQLDVEGSMSFRVNGFEIDKRQVLPDGVDADPAAAVPMLVFSPGAYTVAVDTPLARSDDVPVLADAPLASVAVDVRARPTDEFVSVVQQRVDEFLAGCADQRVLQPTGCPFGFVVQNRLEQPPVWSIVTSPRVTIEPDGAGWRIPPVRATAHISVSIRSIFDGSLRQVEEDVPFAMTGRITIQPDGSASITVTGVDD